MIFIGYSSGDRYTVVESLVFHLKNYGFEVWYGFHVISCDIMFS